MQYQWMMKKLFIAYALFFLPFSCYAFPVKTVLHVSNAIKHDLALPFEKNVQFKHIANKHKAEKLNQLIPIHVFTGLGMGLGNYQVTALNPDIDGHVGMKQFVQTVNYDLAVFDKKTGQLYSGFPQPNNTLWKGFGGPCETELGKNSMVKYDQLAHRWIVGQIATSTLCIALSTSEDATGAYNRYAFDLNALIVNGKLALWPNALYLSFDVIDAQKNFINVLACALDRKKMLAGQNATIQCKEVPKDFHARIHVSPADLDGTTLPTEPGRPGYFVGLISHGQYERNVFFKYYVNFSNPNKTILDYAYLINGSFIWGMTQAAQPGGSLNVDNNGELIFNRRVVYRQFIGFGSLLTSTPDSAGGSNMGIQQKWREYRFYAGQRAPVLHQISEEDIGNSYARYAGNIAMDKVGNIVLVNNISTYLIPPSVELRYRKIADPLGQLTYRQPLLTGKGSQTASPNKWGTYSSLSIDPADDCTFWSVNEYLKQTGSYNWSTAIIHFKLPNCK